MPEKKKKLLVLIDASSFLYRAFHALPPLTNSRGKPTGAILGVTNMLRKLLSDSDTSHVVMVFDAPGKTFRDELFESYKAQRPPMPDELREQIKPLHDLVQAMGVPMLVEPGVEADDVIGTLAIEASRQGFAVVISTGDKDMAQLVSEQITLENTMYDSRLDREGVVRKFGVKPDQIIDYLTLVGDTSDNIPGIPKVGPKTASKWLGQYGCLDRIVAHADQIKGKVGENLRASLEQIPLSRQLATIKCDLDLNVEIDDLRLSTADDKALREILKVLEFSSWIRQLDQSPDSAGKKSKHDNGSIGDRAEYQAVVSMGQLEKWLNEIGAAEIFAFDTETTSLNYADAEIVGVSFAVRPGTAAYVPFCHRDPDAPEQLDRKLVLDKMRPLLEDERKAKLGQNLKYDANVLANHGIELRGIAHDTMLESYVLNSTASRHDMDSLALKYLGYQTIHYEDVAGKGAKQISFQDVPLETAAPYAAEDADITLRLHQHLWPKLNQQGNLRKVYQNIELPLVPVLSRIERTGVLVNTEMLARQSVELANKMEAIERQAYALAGQPFNLASPKQIQDILYGSQKLPVLKKTPKGQPSTAESVLQELAMDYELPRLILEHRGMSKLKSTYTARLPQQVSRATGRVHTSYHQAVAATGRLSSSDPNLQNIPVRSEEGRKIRQAFIAPEGHKILAADYSQIELRIMAHLSGDQGLLTAFAEGADIHRATASEVFGVVADNVSNEQRRSAKAINFGLIYGMSAFGLSRQLGVPRDQAQNYINLYFARYPGVRKYMDDARNKAREQGYVETIFGRRLYLPEIASRNAQRRQYAERTAINAPMQGSAADIIKRAMIEVDSWLAGKQARMIMQVHDELVFEIADEFVTDGLENIRQFMASAGELNVALIVDIGIGDNWDEAH